MEVEIPDPEYSGEELQRTARLFLRGQKRRQKRLPKICRFTPGFLFDGGGKFQHFFDGS